MGQYQIPEWWARKNKLTTPDVQAEIRPCTMLRRLLNVNGTHCGLQLDTDYATNGRYKFTVVRKLKGSAFSKIAKRLRENAKKRIPDLKPINLSLADDYCLAIQLSKQGQNDQTLELSQDVEPGGTVPTIQDPADPDVNIPITEMNEYDMTMFTHDALGLAYDDSTNVSTEYTDPQVIEVTNKVDILQPGSPEFIRLCSHPVLMKNHFIAAKVYRAELTEGLTEMQARALNLRGFWSKVKSFFCKVGVAIKNTAKKVWNTAVDIVVDKAPALINKGLKAVQSYTGLPVTLLSPAVDWLSKKARDFAPKIKFQVQSTGSTVVDKVLESVGGKVHDIVINNYVKPTIESAAVIGDPEEMTINQAIHIRRYNELKALRAKGVLEHNEVGNIDEFLADIKDTWGSVDDVKGILNIPSFWQKLYGTAEEYAADSNDPQPAPSGDATPVPLHIVNMHRRRVSIYFPGNTTNDYYGRIYDNDSASTVTVTGQYQGTSDWTYYNYQYDTDIKGRHNFEFRLVRKSGSAAVSYTASVNRMVTPRITDRSLAKDMGFGELFSLNSGGTHSILDVMVGENCMVFDAANSCNGYLCKCYGSSYNAGVADYTLNFEVIGSTQSSNPNPGPGPDPDPQDLPPLIMDPNGPLQGDGIGTSVTFKSYDGDSVSAADARMEDRVVHGRVSADAPFPVVDEPITGRGSEDSKMNIQAYNGEPVTMTQAIGMKYAFSPAPEVRTEKEVSVEEGWKTSGAIEGNGITSHFHVRTYNGEPV